MDASPSLTPSAAGSAAYAANCRSDTVTPIDTVTNMPGKAIVMGSGPLPLKDPTTGPRASNHGCFSGRVGGT
jgi:YVTN family beta-propeller protein